MRLLLAILFSTCYNAKAEKADLRSFYKEYEVFPDIFEPNDKVAEEILILTYGNEKLINGKEYAPASLLEAPTINPPENTDPNAYYTLVYFCPDWFSRDFPNLRHFIMWLVINIPGNDFTKGDTIVEYVRPGPLKSSKRPARYLFSLFKQPAGKMTIDIPYHEHREVGMRQGWSVTNFIAQYNLGDPVAVLGIESSYDSTVPQLQKEFMSFKKKTKR